MPVGQKLFGENVYVLMQRVVSKCFVKTMRIDDLADLDDVAFKALIAIQPNVGSVVFSGTYGVSSTGEFVGMRLGFRKINTMGKDKAGGSASG